MGKRGGKKFKGGRGGRGGRDRGGGGGQRSSEWRMDFKEVIKENERFENYYNELGLVEQDERQNFWEALRRDLPNSFRFAGSKGHALAVQKRLKDHYIPQISAMDHHNGEKVEPPFPLAWYPNELAWAMTTPKNILRRHPPFASFQRFLVSETSVGNISRQEAVSMIPPLLMDIRPGMTVLDLCAAPGSKAAQLIEMVHAGEEVRTGQVLQDLAMGREPQKTSSTQEGRNVNNLWADDGRSTGLLIANDADYKRSHMLIHQMKRLNSPNLIVTNHDATAFPSIRLTPRPPRPGQQVQHRYLKFDRILADVPCSGDGTMRKNPNIWKDWNPSNAMGLHQTQIRILVRALQMLKVGGRVVYSTCSMNPVENEAVIASAIERCGGSAKVSIVDCSNELGELKRRPGLSSWSVMDKVGRIWNSWAEVEAHRETAGLDGLGRIIEGMFAPKVASDGKALPFERCMRVYGHLQDTGAFFITVLEKLSEIKARPEAEPRSEPTFVPEPSPSVSQRSTVASAAPISEMIEKLSETHETNGDALQKLDALDALLPPEVGPLEDASAAARQNQENEATQTSKRGIEDIEDAADATMATKRPKFRDEVDEKAPEGAEDRQVHWPPPPGAELDLTRHQSTTVSLETPVKAPAPTASADSKKNKSSQPYEEPFKYLPANHKELEVIYDFYRLSPRFPRDRFLVRNAAGDPAKTIYYSTELAKEILSQNEGLGIKFVHCGVKMFMKQDTQKLNTCKWRIQTEGMQIIEGWVGEGRVVRLQKRETLRKLLIEMFPKVNQDGWRALGEIGERVRDIDTGCCVLRVEPSDADDEFSERMVMPLWKSLYSLNLMLPKEDRSAMLLRLFNDSTPLEHKSFRPSQHGSNNNTEVGTNGGNDVAVTTEDVTIKEEEAVTTEDVMITDEEAVEDDDSVQQQAEAADTEANEEDADLAVEDALPDGKQSASVHDEV